MEIQNGITKAKIKTIKKIQKWPPFIKVQDNSKAPTANSINNILFTDLPVDKWNSGSTPVKIANLNQIQEAI